MEEEPDCRLPRSEKDLVIGLSGILRWFNRHILGISCLRPERSRVLGETPPSSFIRLVDNQRTRDRFVGATQDESQITSKLLLSILRARMGCWWVRQQGWPECLGPAGGNGWAQKRVWGKATLGTEVRCVGSEEGGREAETAPSGGGRGTLTPESRKMTKGGVELRQMKAPGQRRGSGRLQNTQQEQATRWSPTGSD